MWIRSLNICHYSAHKSDTINASCSKLDTKCTMIYSTEFCHHICPDFHYCESAGLNLFKTEITTASCTEPKDCSGQDLSVNSSCDLDTSSQGWKETCSPLVLFVTKSKSQDAHFRKFLCLWIELIRKLTDRMRRRRANTSWWYQKHFKAIWF